MKIQKSAPNLLSMTVSLDSGPVEAAFEKAFQQARKQLRVKGFRKGKVPDNLALQHLSDAQLRRRVVKLLVPQAYKVAVKQAKIQPLGKPEWQLKQCGRGQELIFLATVQIFPILEITGYDGFAVQRPQVQISDEQVEEQLSQRRRGLARYLDREAEAQARIGDFCVVDYSASHQGQDLPQAQVKNFLLEMREEKFLPGFVDRVLGAQLGEERNFSLKLPESYAHQGFAGKVVDFKLRIREIKQRVLPPLDDDFAQRYTDSPSLSELRKKIRQDLQAQAGQRLREDIVNEIIKSLVGKIDFQIVPGQLREAHTQLAFQNQSKMLQQQGLTVEQYLRSKGLAPQEFGEEIALKGLVEARLEILYRSIAAQENLLVTKSEVMESIRLKAHQLGRSPEELKARILKDDSYKILAYRLLIAKVRRVLWERAQISFIAPPQPPSGKKSVLKGKKGPKRPDKKKSKAKKAQQYKSLSRHC